LSKKLYIINGPNLNLLGTREPEKYGNISLDKIKTLCSEKCKNYKLDLNFYQSNIEGELIDVIHKAIEDGEGIIINAGALTHTSIGLLDALNMFKKPKIELHITNIYARENFRHKSYISPVVDGIIAGFGFYSYIHAIDAIKNLIKN
jgi:3-dehydroquinate dehydratase-2